MCTHSFFKCGKKFKSIDVSFVLQGNDFFSEFSGLLAFLCSVDCLIMY